MKWVFLLALLIAVPLFAGLFRSNSRSISWAGVAIGFLPFGLAGLHLYVAPVSWAGWPGPVQGIEVSLLDAVALALVLVLPRVRLATPVVVAFAFYFVAVLFSSAISQHRVPASFYIWQLARTALLCAAVARASARYQDFPIRVLIGAAAGLVIQAGFVASQFAHGQAQAGGQFGQNTLGIMSDFVIFPAVALLLAARRTAFALAVFACDLVVVIGGGSRATVGVFALGLVITMMISCWHKLTSRKTMIAAVAIFGLAAAAPALIWAVNRRSEEARASSNAERESFIKAARLMISDHPLGVGPNQYVITANVNGYSERAGVPWNYAERSAPVHNSYYLVTAEMGYFGLASFAALLAATILVGLRAVKHAGQDTRANLLIGAVSTIILVAVHIGFEWIAMTFVIHYLLAIAIGLVLGLRLDVRRPGIRIRQRPAAEQKSLEASFV